MSKTSPFHALRVDPSKVSGGVWVVHPETGDRLRLRRLWCREHVAAYLAAKESGSADVEAVALATGVIVDWGLAAEPSRPYDAAAMAAALASPHLAELASWVRAEAADRQNYRPDEVSQ